MDLIKVSAKSTPKAVAGAIAAVIRSGSSAEVQSVGAGATNQAVKSIAIARTYLLEEQVEIICYPSCSETEINGEARTAMQFAVEKR